jgi:foldase protein PrsA
MDTRRPPARGLNVALAILLLLVGVAVGAGVMHLRNRARSKEVVAAVNGTPITKDQFYRRLEKNRGGEALKSLVDEELLRQYAQKQGVLPGPAQLKAEVDRLKAEKSLPKNFVPDEQFLKEVQTAQSLLAIAAKDVKVSEQEVRSFYNRNSDKSNPSAIFYTPPSVTLDIIVNPSAQKAQEAASKLRSGIPFPTVVSDLSEDKASKANGGRIGPILRGRTVLARIQGLESRIFGMRIGEQIGPEKFGGAYWIIKCLDRAPERKPKFEEVRGEAEKWAKNAKGLKRRKEISDAFEDFRKKARIQAFWKQYKNAITPQ